MHIKYDSIKILHCCSRNKLIDKLTIFLKDTMAVNTKYLQKCNIIFVIRSNTLNMSDNLYRRRKSVKYFDYKQCVIIYCRIIKNKHS